MTFAISTASLALQQSGQGSLVNAFTVQIVLIIAIFYFLIIRPQQKQRKTHEEALRNLKRGDRIVTTGGIIGDVIHIKETPKDGKSGAVMDDEITIKSGESRLIVERGRIGKILSQTTSVTTT